MLIIWGFKTYTRLLATLDIVCSNCHNPAAHRVFKIVRKFTLFFIPLFPVHVTRRIDCTFCGFAQKLTKDQAEQILAAHAASTAPAPAPAPEQAQQPPIG